MGLTAVGCGDDEGLDDDDDDITDEITDETATIDLNPDAGVGGDEDDEGTTG